MEVKWIRAASWDKGSVLGRRRRAAVDEAVMARDHWMVLREASRSATSSWDQVCPRRFDARKDSLVLLANAEREVPSG